MTNSEINQYIGQQIKHHRKLLKLTQSQLGLHVGGHGQTYIAKIESGEVGVSLSKMFEFCSALNITIYNLIPATPSDMSVEKSLKEQTISDIVDLLKLMDEGMVSMFKSMIAAVADDSHNRKTSATR